jgi:hypothetical protein
MFGVAWVPPIDETAREPTQISSGCLDFAQQQRAGIRTDRATVQSGGIFVPEHGS